jgi:hypothetical protein
MTVTNLDHAYVEGAAASRRRDGGRAARSRFRKLIDDFAIAYRNDTNWCATTVAGVSDVKW